MSGLLQQTSGIDHEEVLKACNATLKTSPHDIEVLQTKAVALLNLERYDDALRILDHGGQDLQHRTRFEKAYALYKTGELDAAKELSKSILDSIGAKHVEAQAASVPRLGFLQGLIFGFSVTGRNTLRTR